MIIAQSVWRKTLVTAVAAAAFVSLYDVTMLDSKYGLHLSSDNDASRPPAPGDRLAFTASAYCKGLTTTAGVAVQSGVVAADPLLLPMGSVVQVDVGNPRYDGIYSVLDTGPGVQGRQIDFYMWSCNEALEFGRRPLTLTVLRLGWNPRATTPGLLNRLFSRPVPKPGLLPSRPLPQMMSP
jgi:3D (Asp-Asp-Asp) domain-containing protein